MKHLRRGFLKLAGGSGALVTLAATGLLKPVAAWAAPWNKNAFESKAAADVIKNLGSSNLIESKDITITAPDIAEKNPFPLAASVDFSGGGEGYVSTRLKMGQTSDVRAIVKADGKFYTAVKEVKVTVGGCG